MKKQGFFARFRVDAFMEPEGVVAVDDARSPFGALSTVECVGYAVVSRGERYDVAEWVPGPPRYRYVNERELCWYDPPFTRLVVLPGQDVPPWYYALGYFDFFRGARGEAVFFFLPVALLVRALRWLDFLWCRARCRPSWFDVHLSEARYMRTEGPRGPSGKDEG